MTHDRASGILLHVSSLPSPYGIGDLGPAARRFLQFLHDSGQRVWQVLPLVPVEEGGSPYSSPSTFAGNALLISPDDLVEDGLLPPDAPGRLAEMASPDANAVDYRAALVLKNEMIETALERFQAGPTPGVASAYEAFSLDNAYWLDDYALYTALKEFYEGQPWTRWPEPLARRRAAALEEARKEHSRRIEHHRFAQFLFERQWNRIRERATALGIRIFGDLPIYVAHDSADVWAHPDLFHLDERGEPTVVAGVPPDYFSETGQRWGNPIYRWELMAERGYEWWLNRLARCFEQVDLLRIDHFRGLAAYWEIPVEESTAVNGQWVPGPGAGLFRAAERKLGELPIVAEDLGLITEEVTELMQELGFPGMAVLHFAFGGDAEASYLPHNYTRNLVAYTGTHDNDTTIGWWRERVAAEPGSHEAKERDHVRRYVEFQDDGDIHWAFVRMLMASVAELVVFPLQDVLGLGAEARMNVPGKNEGNWRWRLDETQWPDELAVRLREMVEVFGRGPKQGH